mgnify:CR=1 FL=1
MPKVVVKRFKNAEQGRYLKDRTDLYNMEIKERFGDKVSVSDITEYLKCSRRSVTRYLQGVKHVGGSRLYNSIDVARQLAYREEGLV